MKLRILTFSAVLLVLSAKAQPLTVSELGWNNTWKKIHNGIIVDPTNGCGIVLEAETIAYLQCVTTNASNSFLPADWPRNWGVTNCTFYACGGSSNNVAINIPRLVNETVQALKANGLWSKMDALYLFPFCFSTFGNTNTLIMNSINLINPSTTDLRLEFNPTFVTDTNITGDGFTSLTNNPLSVIATFATIGTWPRAVGYELGFGTYIIDSPLNRGFTGYVITEVTDSSANKFIYESGPPATTDNGFQIQMSNIYGEYAFTPDPPNWKGFHHLSTFYNSGTTNLSWTFFNNGTTLSTNGTPGGLDSSIIFYAPGYNDGAGNYTGGKMGAAFLTQSLNESEQLQLNGTLNNVMTAFGRK